MRPQITELTLEQVQAALNQISDTLTAVARRGETTAWEPKMLVLPEHDTIVNPKVGAVAWSRTAVKLVRWNGDEWVQAT